MDWETGHVSGLIAQVIPPTVTPGGMAILHIVVSASTPPGSYPFTLRGETQGTFKTSEDMVTVVVQPSPKSHETTIISQKMRHPKLHPRLFP
jgi:hypothetical protein